MTLLLTRADVAAVLTPADCLQAVGDAFRSYGDGRAAAPKSVGFHASRGTFHIKAAMADVMATKINANFPDNPSRNQLPTIQGVIVVMDCDRGAILAILDSTLITSLRTAAATAVAAQVLARENATKLTVIGCGIQGRSTVEALCDVRAIDEVVAYDIEGAGAERFAQQLADRLRIGVRVAGTVDEAVRDADIIATCTTARTAILDVHHLQPGLFIAAVGADNPEKQELTPALLSRTRIVVDLLDQAATMGDLHHALESGVLRRDDVHGELADVICGRVRGRTCDEEIFVFDSTGTALQDVAVASIAVQRAMERGAGVAIAFA
jgi:alanine dehydrogenase